MTKHNANRSDITLPLLIDYVDAILPSLTTQTNTTNNQSNESTDLLWVMQDQEAKRIFEFQLNNHMLSDNYNISTKDRQKPSISTLSKLSQQQVPERYGLACFWLPTLSPELLQQYIPLLMRYRDLYAAHLLIALNNNIDLKAYGFTPFDILSEQSLENEIIDKLKLSLLTSSADSATVWQFNLYDYKQLPNWFNADYWANPENWDKNRW